MRKERLTYRDLLRRLLAGRLLRLEERRRAEDALGIPDDVEIGVRVAQLLAGLAERGKLVRYARRPGDRATIRRYLDPQTNDYWTLEVPGPSVVHPGGRDGPAAAPPSPPAPESGAAEKDEREEVPREERRAPERPAESPEPKLVQPVEERDPVPAIAARFRDAATGEPQRTLFSTFAPCHTPEELAEALGPIRDRLVECTSATDAHFHVVPEEGGEPVAVPVRDDHEKALHDLGGRVADAVLGRRRTLHLANLAARDTGAEPGETGALVVLPLAIGDRTIGALEVLRAEPGPFDEDELALFALGAEVAAGVVARAEVLEKLIFLDRLTGLYNRAYFDDQIEREIERANRMGTSVALLMADLDHFKRINDTLGHQAGDLALAHVASIIRSNIRQIDVAARYGGEEFAILLPSINRGRAARTAERLRRVVADTLPGEVIPELADVRMSISLGFALYPDDAATAKQLIERADRVALYAAKNNGRNRVVPWSAARDQRVRVRSDR